MSISLLAQVAAIPNLTRAWREMAENNGIAGVDNISVQRWQRRSEERIYQLAHHVLAHTYKPQKLRVRRIPKKRPGEFRELRIPTVTDRVLQRAVLQTLSPIFEREFLDVSCGYRPRRGLKQAIEKILIIRTNGYRYVLDADIDDFFNRVDHTLLMNFLKSDLPDGSLLNLLASWLQVGRLTPEEARGIPMGSPLSPLLANIFLHRLDKAVYADGFKMVRYADDFVVFAKSLDELKTSYAKVERALAKLKLIYEPSKTRMTTFDKGFQFVGVWFEADTYEYIWQNKRIEVHGDEVDWLFSQYGPDYG